MTLAACVDVTVEYAGARRALDGVSLVVEPQERLAVQGRSGSGKTTLLHVLGGLVEPTAGTVEWQGAPLQSIDRSARYGGARGIGLVFQGANLLSSFTALENVSFASFVSGVEADGTLEPSALLQLVGLADKSDHLPDELSGGEAQRVAIARALAQHPKLLLCDEPTGHLDSDTGRRVLDLIDALQARFQFALVVATHDADVAARYGRSLVMHDGRVVDEVFA